MIDTIKQTWWDKEIKDQFDDFKSWVGSSQAPSKVFMRKWLAEHKINSILDIGCGMCDEFEAYKKEYPNIQWTGVEGSVFLHKKAIVKGKPVVNKEGHNIGFTDGAFDVSYARHVLEHQKSYKPILKEMIRVASKIATHTFFIAPQEKEIINYNKKLNLYHNTFNKNKIEEFVKSFDKVKSLSWLTISKVEVALVIFMK